MNFLFHHHLAMRDLGSPEAGVGAMLPDLWRMADRKVRAQRLDPSTMEGAQRSEVLRGIDHHLDADLWFHGDAVFAEGERATADALKRSGASAPRLVLFAHVTWEMCLDGALVRALGGDALLVSVREGLASARASGELDRSARLHHWDRDSRPARGDDDRAVFDARMQYIEAELHKGAWVLGYASGEGIAARLSGIRARLGIAPLSPDDHARVAAVAEDLLALAGPFVGRIVEGPRFGRPAGPSLR